MLFGAHKNIAYIRVGSRIKRVMDEPTTPQQRLLKSETVDTLTKRKLAEEIKDFNSFYFKEHIDKQLDTIVKIIKTSKGAGYIH